jgi:DNA-binding transcriptional ArsR family regulator
MFMTNGFPGGGGVPLSKLVASLGDPLGRDILRHCEERGAPTTARELAKALDAPLGDVERHVDLLVAGEALVLVQVQRGEPVYRSSLDRRMKWVREVLTTSREVDEERPAG